jgi:tight adherence protein B
MDNLTLIIFAGVSIIFIGVVFAVQAVVGQPRKQMAKRVQGLQTRMAYGDSSGVTSTSLRREMGSDRFKFLETLTKRFLPNADILKAKLARTGKTISIGSFIAAMISLATVVSGLNTFVFGLNPALGVLGGIAAGVAIPYKIVGFLGERRLKAFTAIFPDAIDLIVRGLKSGLPISECVASVGAEMADPVGVEFRHITDAVKIGQTLEEALWETAGRLDTPDFKFFVITLNVQKETGGNLAETLANLSNILRQRKQMKLKIKALSSEAKASAYILGSLPFLMAAILFFINSEYIMTLFRDPRGHTMVLGGLISLAIGVTVMFRMVRFEI